MPYLPKSHSKMMYDKYRKVYEQARIPNTFYSTAAWIRCRASILADNPLCMECRKMGRIVPAVEVHHKTERADRPDLAFDRENLSALCKQCHSRITANKNWGR